jgi:hypothetical protein
MKELLMNAGFYLAWAAETFLAIAWVLKAQPRNLQDEIEQP